MRKKQFFRLKCSLRTPKPPPPSLGLFGSHLPSLFPLSLFLKHCYKKVIFGKDVRGCGVWRNRKICSVNVVLKRCWTHVEGKDISQIWDETLVLIKWLNSVRIPLWSSRGSNWIFTKRAWNKSFWLAMIYFELNV